MANITLNIEGNLNIFLDGRDDAPCSMYLDNDNDTVEFQSVPPDAADCDEEDNAIVLFAHPGEDAERMTLFEALKPAWKNGGLDSVEIFPAFDLLIAFNSDDVIGDSDGNLFLAGPVLIFNLMESALVSLTEEEMEVADEVLKAGTVKLYNGKEAVPAYAL